MNILIIFVLILVIFLFHCLIIEVIGFIYAFITLAWAEILIAEESKYGDIYVTKTRISKKILLIHNGVVHSIHDEISGIPDGYCHLASGVVEVLLNKNMVSDTARITLIGVGGGAILHYARLHQQWQGYEIDPIVIKLANNYDVFKFVTDCPAQLTIYNADGFVAINELQLQDVIIVDTFFGERNLALPTALEKLIIESNANTIFLLHVSGLSKLDVASIIEIGSSHKFIATIKETPYYEISYGKCHFDDFQHPFIIPSKWMLMSRNREHIY